MEGKEWMALISEQTQTQAVVRMNQRTEKFGLALTEEEARQLVSLRRDSLREQQRVEFGEGILPKLIDTFCNSSYIDGNNYVQTVARLQDIFYLYKNEMLDEITDDELLQFMREQFDTVCFGDLDYLEETCLDIFAQAIRAGYRNYKKTGGRGEFTKMDIVKRWDRGVYLQALSDLM